jgi:hypothetical protein
LHDGRAVNGELVGEVIDRCAGQVALDEAIDVSGDE